MQQIKKAKTLFKKHLLLVSVTIPNSLQWLQDLRQPEKHFHRAVSAIYLCHQHEHSKIIKEKRRQKEKISENGIARTAERLSF